MPRAAVLALLVTLLHSTPATAQVCRGYGSFDGRPFQLSARGQFNAHAKSYGATLAVGGAGLFGDLDVARTDLDIQASSSVFGVSAGYQGSLNKGGTAQLCPVARLGFVTGPQNINGTGIDYSETDFSFGLDAGVIATSTTQQLEVVPTASLAIAAAHANYSRGSASLPNSQSLSYAVVGLGVGFVFGQEVTVTPSVFRPIGLSGASTSFAIAVAFHLGGQQLLAIPSRPTACAGLATTDSVVYDTTQLTERPSLRSAPVPVYPPMQRELRIEGQVIMAVTVDRDGTPEQGSARIVQGVDGGLDREALRWIQRASYWPGCYDGRPVRARIAQPLAFCLFGKCPRHP
jgi:TonB family protein